MSDAPLPRHDAPVVLASVVGETVPGKTAAVAADLAAREGVEVHETQGYKLVVTIEAATTGASHAVASGFAAVPGVTGVNLVSCNFEDEFAGR